MPTTSARQLAYSVPELAEATNESVAVWRKRIWRREIEHVKCGRNVRVLRSTLEQWLLDRMVPAGGTE